jgi:hypothetical protein
LDDDRLVETELHLELLLVGRVHHAGGIEQDVADVARDDAQHHENEH